MTNSANTSTRTSVQNFARPAGKSSDEAPMVVTRLSGWIDFGEVKSATPSWIVRTRARGRTR